MKIDMEFARRDNCLDNMVPSDLRLLVGRLERAEAAQEDYVRQLEDEIRENAKLREAAQAVVDAHEKAGPATEHGLHCACMDLLKTLEIGDE
jgi:hypothetical protein